MAALLSIPRRRFNNRSCHFCGAKKSEDCDCGGWTRKDENANLIDYLPQMSDPNLNPKPPRAVPLPRRTLTVSPKLGVPSHTSSTDSQFSPYCSTCLANQNIQINLLANYIPGDSDPGASKTHEDTTLSTKALMADLPAYKASLESRYPLLCTKCSPKIAEIIKQRNYQMKAFSLNESAKRLAKPLKPTLRSSSPTKGTLSLPIYGMGGKIWNIQEWLWSIQGFLWVSSYTLSILVAFHSSLSFECYTGTLINPQSSTRFLLVDSNSISISYCCCLEVLCSFFDFTWSRVRKNRSQGIRTKVIGKRRFMCLNIIACFIRLFLWVYLFCNYSGISPTSFDEYICALSPLVGQVTFGLIGVLLLAIFTVSLIVLKTDSPIGVKPLTGGHKIPSLALPPLKPALELSEDELFSTLSLARPVWRSSDHQTVHSHPSSASSGVSAEHKFGKSTVLQTSYQSHIGISRHSSFNNQPSEVPMDWEPISPPDYQLNDMLLRPQTFLPPPALREETGIEDLFSQKARLDPELEDQSKPSSWLRRLLMIQEKSCL